MKSEEIIPGAFLITFTDIKMPPCPTLEELSWAARSLEIAAENTMRPHTDFWRQYNEKQLVLRREELQQLFKITLGYASRAVDPVERARTQARIERLEAVVATVRIDRDEIHESLWDSIEKDNAVEKALDALDELDPKPASEPEPEEQQLWSSTGANLEDEDFSDIVPDIDDPVWGISDDIGG